MTTLRVGPAVEPDPAFERFARLVQAYLGVPIALVSLAADAGWVAFPGAVGLGEPLASQRILPVADTLCRHVLRTEERLVVADARELEEVTELALLAAVDAVAYAGYPVRDGNGKTVGSLCALDTEPHDWGERELAILSDLADACSTQVQLYDEGRRAREAELQATRRHEHARALLEMSEAFSATTDVIDVVETIESVAQGLGVLRISVALTDGRGHVLDWFRHADVPGMPESVWRGAEVSTDAWPYVVAVQSRVPLYFADGAAILRDFPRVGEAAGTGAVGVLPLVTRSAAVGVLVLRWTEPRVIEGELRDLLTALAGYAALALERARLLEHRRDVAHVLQTAMLTHLPAPEGLTLDGAYAPASMGEQVGGDWYDALVLPGRGTAVMIGDVTGHDIDAAALMGQLRSLLRGYTWADEDQPSVVLHRLDAANIGTGLGATASVVLGHLEPPSADGSRLLRWSSAGHLPPFVKRAGGAVERLDARPDLILGVVPGAERHDHDVLLHPGDTLVLYTDGLVERRGEALHVGLERLAAALRDAGVPEPRALVETLVPDEFHQDDTAVLTVLIAEPATAAS